LISAEIGCKGTIKIAHMQIFLRFLAKKRAIY